MHSLIVTPVFRTIVSIRYATVSEADFSRLAVAGRGDEVNMLRNRLSIRNTAIKAPTGILASAILIAIHSPTGKCANFACRRPQFEAASTSKQ